MYWSWILVHWKMWVLPNWMGPFDHKCILGNVRIILTKQDLIQPLVYVPKMDNLPLLISDNYYSLAFVQIVCGCVNRMQSWCSHACHLWWVIHAKKVFQTITFLQWPQTATYNNDFYIYSSILRPTQMHIFNRKQYLIQFFPILAPSKTSPSIKSFMSVQLDLSSQPHINGPL